MVANTKAIKFPAIISYAAENSELHTFVDASEDAFAACVYLTYVYVYREVQWEHFAEEMKLLTSKNNVQKSSSIKKLSPFLDKSGHKVGWKTSL